MENAVRKDMDLVEAQSWKEFCESLDRLDDVFAENASDELKKDLKTSESIANSYALVGASRGHRPQFAPTAFSSRTLELIFPGETAD